MYKIYFKKQDEIIICNCDNVWYSLKDNCITIEYDNTSYKCYMSEADANSYLISGIKNGYIHFNDRIFSAN